MKQKLIAKIHVLKNQVRLEDDVYRIILERVTGKDSCKLMNMKELKLVIEEFNNTWFIQTAPLKPLRSSKLGSNEQGEEEKTPKYNTYASKSNFQYVDTNCAKMRKIFKLWTQLGEQEKLRDSSNKGLNSFLKSKFNTCYEDINNTHIWHNGIKDQIIEALKSWNNRAI